MRKAGITRRMKTLYDAIVARDMDRAFTYPVAWAPSSFRRGEIEWAAYAFAKRWRSRSGYDAKKLQRIVVKSGNPEVAYLFARDVPGASVSMLERVVVEAGDPKLMRMFSKLSGARSRMLECYALLAETMAM